MDWTVLGEEIRKHRLAKGMTQEELGEACGLSRTSITNIERGVHRIHLDTLCWMADALGVSPATLIREARAA